MATVNGPSHPVPNSAGVDPSQVAYPRSDLKLENHPLDDIRSLRVAVIGAGMSGVLAGVLLPAKVPSIDLKIYEKNFEVVCIKLLERNQIVDSENLIINIFREVRGWRISTPVFAVTYRPMSISAHFLQILNGLKNSPRERKSESIGRTLLRNIMSTASLN